MNKAISNEKEIALRCAVAASNLCQRVQEEMATQEAITKADRSPVTVADFGSQAVICHILKQAFPSDPIVAEETSNELRGQDRVGILSRVTDFVKTIIPDSSDDRVCEWIDLGTKEIAPRYWCLDPIDGTKGFLRGDQYAIALALVIDREVHLGVIACPNLPEDLSRPEGPRGMIFFAIRGEGAFQVNTPTSESSTGQGVSEKRKFLYNQVKLDGEEALPIRVSPDEISQGSRFCESFEPGHADIEAHRNIAKRLGIVEPSIRMDSQAKYGIVARGDASIYLRLPSPKTPAYNEKVWDHAAGAILIEEAGGKITDVMGKTLDFGVGYELTRNTGVIATNGRLHEAVLSAL